MGKYARLTAPKVEEQQPIESDSKISSEIPRYQDINSDDFVEVVRATVRLVGRETSPLRVTRDENEALEDTVYNFKKLRLKTDKNEVVRVGLNYLLWEHEQNGEQSILTRCISRLNA